MPTFARLQIEAEFKRFSKFMDPPVRIGNFVGGIDKKHDVNMLKDASTCPHIVIGTPGRLADLMQGGQLKLDKIQYFVVDECDKVLDQAGMARLQLQSISTEQRLGLPRACDAYPHESMCLSR
jgi:superfamily II DNA/RNA helicase